MGAVTTDPSPIFLPEPTNVIVHLLCLTVHAPQPPWTSYEEFEAVALAADKYQGPEILKLMRGLMTSRFLIQPADREADDASSSEPLKPLEMYQLAAHFSWEREAKWASKNLLYTDVLADEFKPILTKIPSDYLARLVWLQHKRQVDLQKSLDSNTFVGNRIPRNCTSCGRPDPDETWHVFKAAFVRAKLSSEQSTPALLQTMPEAIRCWEARCTQCRTDRYSKTSTINSIVAIVYDLPISI